MLVALVADLGLGGSRCQPGGVLPHPCQIALGVRGVHHHQEIVGRQAVDEKIVDVGAALGQQAAVVRPARRQPRHVVRRQGLQQGLRARAAQADLAHVRDVEQPGGGAHGAMLLDDAGILDRHLPAGEADHARPQLQVAGMKGRVPERRGGGGGCCARGGGGGLGPGEG